MSKQTKGAADPHPMNLGIKIAKNGYDVTTIKVSSGEPEKTDQRTLEAMVSGLGQAFVIGARDQLGRYLTAVELANKDSINVLRCLHEALGLLEDLDTLSWYTQVCGETHNLNSTIRHMRNHARHDIRENIDHLSNDGRKKRVRKLGIAEHLLVHIGFDKSGIKMGTTFLSLEEINDYINWTDKILLDVIREGIKNEKIKGVSINEEHSK